VIAHRGASSLAPENTLAAYVAAIEAGADFIELDVQMTGDEELVCIHDEAVDRTTNGTGTVAAMRLEEIRNLDAGSWFYGPDVPVSWPTHMLTVPTFKEVLEVVRGRCSLLIEIKGSERNTGVEDRLVAVLRQAGMEDGVALQCYPSEATRRMAALAPDLARFEIVTSEDCFSDDALDEIRVHAQGIIGPSDEEITPERVHAAHECGIAVFSWPVNSPDRIRALAGTGVDGIQTDNPLLLRWVLNDTR
jgi:glycerophosphoryl diester phosphodiesterase